MRKAGWCGRARRAELRESRGDVEGAVALARTGVSAYPATVSAAAMQLLLDRRLGPRTTVQDLMTGAGVDAARGHAAEGAERLRRALALAVGTPTRLFDVALRRAQLPR